MSKLIRINFGEVESLKGLKLGYHGVQLLMAAPLVNAFVPLVQDY